MKFTIVIPTYKRITKLERCIKSILAQTHQNFDITVICDNNDEDTYKWVKENYSYKVDCILNKEHGYVIGCINSFLKNNFDKVKDCFLFLCDDTELYPDCLGELNKTFSIAFPNKDGVVGIAQEVPGYPNAQGTTYGQTVIGKNFIGRYPEQTLCCPDYDFWFQDEETYEFAKSQGKFVFEPRAVLKHYHPCRIFKELDDTHSISRGNVKRKDDETYRKRKEQGFLWGKSWKLINLKKQVITKKEKKQEIIEEPKQIKTHQPQIQHIKEDSIMPKSVKECLLELQDQVDLVVSPKIKELKNIIGTHSNHYEFLYLVMRCIKPNVTVEIGTHRGVSACSMKAGHPEGKLYTIDINPNSGDLLDKDIVRIIGNSSQQTMKVPCEIDLLYIDGDHTFRGAQKDLEAFLPLMKKGGLIFVDDVTSKPEMGVRKFWKKLKKDKLELSRPIQEIIDFEKIHGEWGFGCVIV